MKNNLVFLFSFLAVLFSVSSCSKDDAPVPEELTILPSTSLTIAPEGETKTFSVKSNYAWTVTCSDWITLTTKGEPASDVAVTVAATIGKNSTDETRVGKITIKLSSGMTQEITVTQDCYQAPAGIYNATDLADFAKALDAEEPDLSKWVSEEGTIRLQNDIDVSELQCLPMEAFPKNAILDGQGYTITMNLTSTSSKIGLFKSFNGTAKNLSLSGVITVSGNLSSETHIGALAADAQNATLDKCNNHTSISINATGSTTSLHVIAGGFIGKAVSSLSATNCTNSADMSFTSDAASKGAYHTMGGIIGSYGSSEDEGICKLSGCKNEGNINCNSGDSGSWNYVGALVGDAISKTLSGTDYSYILENCISAGKIDVAGVAKTRVGGVTGRINAYNHINNCQFSGTITLHAADKERNVGGISSFQEKGCLALIENCTFSGRIESEQGHTARYYIGGIVSSGCAAGSIIQNCKTTKTAFVSNYLLGNISMIIGQGSNACTIKNCKVAGTIDNSGVQTIISAANYTDTMCTGLTGSVAVAENCGFNAE